jgi:hypothetical protein
MPRDAALLNDTLLYVADMGNHSVRILSTTGADRGTIKLRFAPQGIGLLRNTLLISPVVMAANRESLVFLADREQVHPLPVAVTEYDDVRWTGLGNMTLMYSAANGDVLVTHRFMSPVAYLLRAGSRSVERLVVPLPAGEARKVGRLPPLPLTEENESQVAVPVISGALDQHTGDFSSLTRSGETSEAGYPEVALVQTDKDLVYRRSWRLRAAAAHLGYLRTPGVFVIVDRDDMWYTCPVPGSN